ncbi:hypothetical protein J5A68_11610 [Prevotella melaninogenica]|nr:hypothetical protein J5A68_11610 [Prevotella melaninogenica]
MPLEDSYFTAASCDEKLKNLIISCHNFKTPFNKKDIHAEIEEEISDGIYRVRLFVYSNGENSTSSIGWIILDTKKNILKDISLDPESPVTLKYNKDSYKDYLENCLEKKVPSSIETSIATNYDKIPVIHFPFEYSYDFINDLTGTMHVNKTIMHFISTLVDSDTDLGNCCIARLPSTNHYHYLLIFASDHVGERRFFLCILNNKYKLTDRLLIYKAKNISWKGRMVNSYLYYIITGSNKIILKEMIARPNKDIVIKKKEYISVDGKFRLH